MANIISLPPFALASHRLHRTPPSHTGRSAITVPKTANPVNPTLPTALTKAQPGATQR